ncbi:RHS repeat-associated core domain-containing protein [Ostreibacterium oceani]|uniref:RHS repeat-associated core domain-containing protein n=1 Tax=Ostreibacterium oceani TaxID=2654998 RepID=A0A6N7EZC5_9GAMM|nr:hypothetical protein [Ostreibacterium oceani]
MNLYQNYHRDYNPNLGRYLQTDPIGLFAGVNTYSYTNNQPVNFSDYDGLQRKSINEAFDDARKELVCMQKQNECHRKFGLCANPMPSGVVCAVVCAGIGFVFTPIAGFACGAVCFAASVVTVSRLLLFLILMHTIVKSAIADESSQHLAKIIVTSDIAQLETYVTKAGNPVETIL